MDIYVKRISDLTGPLAQKILVVDDVDQLNRHIAAELADALAEKIAKNEMLTVICPVGPLNYRYFTQEVIKRNLSCKNLRTVNMDEYLDDNDRIIDSSHPLSFRRFMEETFFSHLPEELRPLPENIIFPNPDAPQLVTQLIDDIGGADICWAGFGITGHVAFNDPPFMTGESTKLEDFRVCKTRKIEIPPMSFAQMAIGGTNGNLDILPRRAVTIGMYEMLKSKKFILTFMRNWHAGLWRRAFLGPVTSQFPGSLIQEHPNFSIVMTTLAAEPPMINTAQEIGETKN